MNDAYYFISLCHNNDSCVYMTTDNTQDFTTLPPEPRKAIIYFTSKELAEKYIQNITADNKLCVREIHNKEVNRLEWICCYDHNIPFKINGFVGLILLGFILSGSCAFFIWMADRIKHWLEKTDMGTVISIIFMLSLIAYGISILFTKKIECKNKRFASMITFLLWATIVGGFTGLTGLFFWIISHQ